jgi:predicted Zn-dependent peptidase
MVDSSTGRAVGIPPPASDVRRTLLPSGARVVCDLVPASASATVAVWVGVGGRDENPEDAGASHFLEHLLFKGTNDRSATDIAVEVDGMGGEMNAYTSSEYTAYYVRVPSTEIDAATGLLLDVVTRPALRSEEFEAERNVILEELAAADDDPEDVVGQRFYEALFPSHPLGREVLGTAESISGLSRERVARFFESWYQPANIVVTAAGAVDHGRLVERVERCFSDRMAGGRPTRRAPRDEVQSRTVERRPTDLVHLAVGWRIPPVILEDRFTLSLLNQVFGTGPASRLFQEVRERRALSYSISSGLSHFVDAGVWGVQCSTTPNHAAEVLAVVRGIAAEVASEGVLESELARAKRSLRGGLLLALEESGSRAARLGIAETTRGRFTPIEEYLDRIDRVTVDDARDVAARVLCSNEVLSVVGPEGEDLESLR